MAFRTPNLGVPTHVGHVLRLWGSIAVMARDAYATSGLPMLLRDTQ